ncbi:MAG: hypothetical protein JHC95_13020 [Solirubrobacteraceae bacterium]|nr:hypothetical protein [Solirubrobacteraceae bacterium]
MLAQLQPNLLTGVRMSPGRVPVDAAGAPVGASLVFRLSKPADVSFGVHDVLSGKGVGSAYIPVPSPLIQYILPAGPGRVPIVTSPEGELPTTFGLQFLGALRPGRLYALVATASYCSCALRDQGGPNYHGLPQVSTFTTSKAATPPPTT